MNCITFIDLYDILLHVWMNPKSCLHYLFIHELNENLTHLHLFRCVVDFVAVVVVVV